MSTAQLRFPAAQVGRDSLGANLPSGWDTVWRAAYAARATTPAEVMVIGDSIATGGIAGTTPYASGWVSLLRNTLCGGSVAGLASEYFPAVARNGSGFNYSYVDQPWSDWLGGSGTVSYLQTVGYHPCEWTDSTASQAYQTFTAPYACTSAFLHAAHQYSTWGYRINGGSVQTVTYDGNAWGIRRISLGALSAGDTVQWGWQASTQAVMIQGVECVKSSTGVSVSRVAAGGARLTDQAMTGATHFPTGMPDLLAGRNPRTGQAFIDYSNGFPTRPHLAIIAIGVNDCAATGSGGQTNYSESLTRLIAALKRGRNDCSVLLVIYDYPDQDYSDATCRFVTPAAPTISVQGTPGSTSYQVRYTWRGIYGNGAVGPIATVANGPATLSGSDFIRVTMATPPAPAVGANVYYSTDAGSTWRFQAPTLAQMPGNVFDLTVAGTVVTPPVTNTNDLPQYRFWPLFVEQVYVAARKHGAAVLNVGRQWGSLPAAAGYYATTGRDVHPNATGHTAIATAVANVVVPL